MNMIIRILFGIVLAGQALLSGCGSGGSGGSGPDNILDKFGFVLSASKSNILADSNDSTTITATLTAAIPEDQTMTFSIVSGVASLSDTTVPVTTLSGVSTFSVQLKSGTIGPIVVKAKLGAKESNITINANTLAANADRTSVLADGTSIATITARFQGVVPDGTVVIFESNSDTAILSASNATTSNNVATILVRSNTLGTIKVNASSAILTGVTSSVAVTFFQPVTITTTKSHAIANNIDSVTIVASLPVNVPDNTQIDFSLSGGAVFSNGSTTISLGTVNNSASVTVLSSVAGQVNVSATHLPGSTRGVNIFFIVQPVTAIVKIALKKDISLMTSLSFKIINDTGSTLSYSQFIPLGSVLLQTDRATGDPSTKMTVAILSPSGINISSFTPFLQLTYLVNSGSLPNFKVSSEDAITATSFSIPVDMPISLSVVDFDVQIIYQ